MANSLIELFYFYRRYRWTAANFTKLQNSLIDMSRGPIDGLVHQAVLDGLEYQSATGLNATVSPGIAVGPTGQLMAVTGAQAVSFASPVGNPAISLVVIRPNPTDVNYITDPTTPFSSVPLNQIQGAQLVVLNGTPAASPTPPATGAQDTVLFGVRLPAAATGFADSDLDFEIRDSVGKRSWIAKNMSRYDDRCLVYKSTAKIIGVKPSQKNGSQPRQFTYLSRDKASVYPKDVSGNYSEADSFYNLETGAVTGADRATSSFTPTIPTAGKFIVVRVALRQNNTISVKYGTEGTYAQCMNGIKNQIETGAGCLNIEASTMPLALVIIGSANGSALATLDVIDARGSLAFPGVPTPSQAMSANWYPSQDPSQPPPIEDTENNEKIWRFSDGMGQSLFMFHRVPSNYVPGKQIKLKVGAYSANATGTWYLYGTATLVRKAVDAITDVSRYHTSQNTAVTNTVASQYREQDIDLTDASGNVSGASVSPGDILKVRVQRANGTTDPNDVNMIPSATEIVYY